MSVGEELARLARLRDDGVLTEAEFQHQKAVLLGMPSGYAPGPASAYAPPPYPPPPRPADNGALVAALIVVGCIALGLLMLFVLLVLIAD